MKQLRAWSLTLLIMGGIFSTFIFGLLIILINSIKSGDILLLSQIIFNGLATAVYKMSGNNFELFENIKAKPEIVGGILIAISAVVVLLYLVPVCLRKINGFKKFGVAWSFIVGALTLALTATLIIFAAKPINTIPPSFNLGFELNAWIIILFLGPAFTFFGSWFAIGYLIAAKANTGLNEDQKNRLKAINLTTGKIGASGIAPRKESVSQQDIEKRRSEMDNFQQSPNRVLQRDDLKSKVERLKEKMYQSTKFTEEGSAQIVDEGYEKMNNSRWKNPQASQGPAKPVISVGPSGQYLRTVDETKGIIDESKRGVAIEQRGDFVQKGDIIKHHDSYKPNFANNSNVKPKPEKYKGPIIIPRSKQSQPIDTHSLEEKIRQVPLPTGKQRVNPNAKVDNSYDGKVFLGDIEKIYSAGQKYRQDITKNPAANNNNQNGSDNFDPYSDDYQKPQ
ncbi:hypothetical protein [Spiroplasma chrysopicola]|nr:hypothetical protein [Spiroplasma chrysopicola]